MSDVPPEVITEILSRLPVKSLLRFRCVSKSFKTLVDSPKFIKAHLKQQQEPNPNANLNLILEAHKEADNLFSLELTSNTSTQQHPKELHRPLKQLYGPTQVLGSCHGLVLISGMSDNGVWNPSTKRFRRLPVCKFDISGRAQREQGPRMAQICQGFGYDRSGEDYKVVTISQLYYPDELKVVSETMVYSLKFGGWNKVQDCPYWLLKEGNGTCGTSAGGALYWMMQKELSLSFSRLVLVGLNLGTDERFVEVSFPENLGEPLAFNLAALDERLCLISGYGTCKNGKNLVLDHIDVWMIKGCGVEQSWVKLFTVEQLEGRQLFSYLRPIAYSVTGREVLLEMDKRKFLWYSLEKKSLKHAKVSGGLDTFESFATLETLVPLYYGDGDEKDRKKGIEERDDSVIRGNEGGTLKQL